MKKSLLKNLHKLFALIAIFFIISSSLGQIHILAEGECTGDYLRCRAVPLDMSKVTATRDFSQVQTKDVTIPTTETTLVNGGTYSITYLSAIDYYGQKLSLKIDVAIPQDGIKNVGGEHYTDNTIGLTNEKRLGFFLNATASAGGDAYGDGQEGFGANSTQATVSYTFLDASGQTEMPFTGLIGIEDIDGSDYLFGTTGRTVYYVDGDGDDQSGHPNPGAKAADHFIVTPTGVFRDRAPADGDKVGSYNNAMLFIPLNNESTFTFGFSSRSDAIGLPLLYTWKYTIKYNKMQMMLQEAWGIMFMTIHTAPCLLKRSGHLKDLVISLKVSKLRMLIR